MKINPLLLIDFYKSTHHEQYPKGLTKMVSYFTPRMSRLEGQNKLVMFGLQAFIKEYLIEYFNEYFFGRPKDEVLNEYSRVLDNTLGKGSYDLNKIIVYFSLSLQGGKGHISQSSMLQSFLPSQFTKPTIHITTQAIPKTISMRLPIAVNIGRLQCQSGKISSQSERSYDYRV